MNIPNINKKRLIRPSLYGSSVLMPARTAETISRQYRAGRSNSQQKWGKFIWSLHGFFSSFFLIRLQMTALIFPSAAAPADIVATH
jgi:hypothetical protein